MAYPDWDAVDDPPGARSWAAVRYDVAEDGKVTGPRLVASSGNDGYDKQALAAAGQSAFSRGARRGCLAVFRHVGPTLAWPKEPPLKEPASCPIEPKISVEDVSRYYPSAYQQRNVEGWALVSYDVAPWGAVGNVQVVRAEPAEAFGEAARGLVTATEPAVAGHGETGCLVAVAFRFPVEGGPSEPAPLPLDFSPR
jgi:TonB family protein